MTKLGDFFIGIKELETLESPFNGTLTVVNSLAFGTYIKAGGLTQSGGIIKSIWGKALRHVLKSKNEIDEVLILGLGGGSLVGVIGKYWPQAKITAVDIDPLMVNLGKKYLGLDEKNVDIKIKDALNYVQNTKSKFDLICIDLYNGDKYPEKFENEIFLKKVRKILKNEGVAVFNRLYYGDKRTVAVKFLKRLENIYSKVDVVYPEANVMFACYNKKEKNLG